MADHQFEQKVSQQLADFKLKPNAEVWQHVEEQLQEDKRRRRWFIFLPVAALLVGGLLYAVWPPDEAPTKTNVAVQQNNTIPTQQNIAPLTKTGSSNNSTEQPAVEEKTIEQVISGKTNPADIAVQQQPEPAKEIIQQQKQTSSRKNVVAIVEAKPKKSNVTVIIPNEDSIAKQKEAIDENTTKIEQQTEAIPQTDSASATEPILNKTDAVDSNKASLIVDSIVVANSPSKPTIIKRKWQPGVHVSGGVSDIRGSLFPGSGFKSFSMYDQFYSPSGGNAGGQGGVTRIVQYEYAVKPSVHFGAGLLLRKPFKKRNAFVTGLQYQYSSYSVTQRQRIDTFILANNYFSNISIKEKTVKFNMHAVNVPIEFEFKIADIKKGTLLLSAGVQNWFVVSSTQTDTLSSFRYAATTERSAGYGGTVNAKETKATTWQPQLYLSPSFEWKGKYMSSQVGLYIDYGLRPAYKSTSKDYWWQTGIRYRMYFNR